MRGVSSLIVDGSAGAFGRLLLQSKDSASDGLSSTQIGIIVGAAGGGVLLVAIIIIGIVLYMRKSTEPRVDAKVLKSLLIPWKDITLGPVIGEGGMGMVMKGMWQGNRVALKMIKPERVDAATLKALQQEALLQADLKHPDIARIYGIVAEKPNYAIVMHYYRCGTVEKFMTSETRPGKLCFTQLDTVHRIRMCLQVSKAMHFMHNRGMVHADLKLGNLLLEYHNNNANTLRCVVADFGQSRPLARKAGRGDGSVVVSPHVIAPEVIRNPESPRTPAGDVYSFAIVLLEVFAGEPAWPLDMAPKLIMRKVAKGERPTIPGSVPDVVAQIIRTCWAQDPSHRPSFEQLVKILNEAEKTLIDASENKTQYDTTGYL